MRCPNCFVVAVIAAACLISNNLTEAATSRPAAGEKMHAPEETFFAKALDQGIYQKIPPSQQLGLPTPTTVQLGIYINSFDSFSDNDMEFSINIYLRQNWTDPRLAYTHETALRNRTFLKADDEVHSLLWLPDVYFRNEKRAKFHFITTANRMLRIHRNGVVWFVSKVTATLSCPMDLLKFPLDTQVCPMFLESFGYSPKVVRFAFRDQNPVEMEQGLQLNQFSLVKYHLRNCTRRRSCLKIEFVLKRETGFYMIQIYVPTVLIVIMSWITFWINADAIPARTSLGLLTVLTMTTKSSTAGASNVSRLRAVDVWLAACLIFVVSSLIEFAIVHILSRKYAQKHPHQQRRVAAAAAVGSALAAPSIVAPSQSQGDITGTQEPDEGDVSPCQHRKSSSKPETTSIEMRRVVVEPHQHSPGTGEHTAEDSGGLSPEPGALTTARRRSGTSNSGSRLRVPPPSSPIWSKRHQETSSIAARPPEDESMPMMDDSGAEVQQGLLPSGLLAPVSAVAGETAVSNAAPGTDWPHSALLCQKCLSCRGRPPDYELVDRMARMIFPAAFALFNVAYWMLYLVVLD